MEKFSKLLKLSLLILATNVGNCLAETNPLPSPSKLANYIVNRTGGEITNPSLTQEVNDYFNKVKPVPNASYTFSEWKSSNGFNQAAVINSKYYNRADLGLGRDMNCIQSPSSLNRGSGAIACFVSNFGDFSKNDEAGDLQDTHFGTPFATVAMEYHPNAASDKVRFFAFLHTDGDKAQKFVKLDNGDNKPIPHTCISCHGGEFNTNGGVDGSNFLPFDPFAFGYRNESDEQTQLPKLKSLNALVYNSNPDQLIKQFIDGLYGGANEVNNLTSFAVDGNTPSNWQAVNEDLYHSLFKPYCQGCHMALKFDVLDTFNLSTIVNYACSDTLAMPNAEITDRNLGININEINHHLQMQNFSLCDKTVLLPITEGFESAYSWANTSEQKFLKKSGNTPSSNTGPNGAIEGSNYYYFETSSGYAYHSEDTATLESPFFEIDNTEFFFDYHMYGSDIGTLAVDIFSENNWETVFEKTGQQHSSDSAPFSSQRIDLSNYSGKVKLRFRAVAKGGYRGDIAIDNIIIIKKESLPRLTKATLLDPSACEPLKISGQPVADSNAQTLCRSSVRKINDGYYSTYAGNASNDKTFLIPLSAKEPLASSAKFATAHHDMYWGFSFSTGNIISNGAAIEVQYRVYTSCRTSNWTTAYTSVPNAKVFIVNTQKIFYQESIPCLQEDLLPSNRLMFRFRFVNGSLLGPWAYLNPILMRLD